MSRLELTGQKFGRLTVISYAGLNKQQCTCWECQCECGKTVIVKGTNLTRGMTRSCGCLKSNNNRKHNCSKTRLYRIWDGMIRRTEETNRKDYSRYGGRGIRVCDEWKNDFRAFRDWAQQNGYSDSLSIDRIDNDGDYEPSNCRWTDLITQNNHRRSNCYITFDGKTQSMADWARELNIPYTRLQKRHRLGWSPERMLTTQVVTRDGKK